MRLVINEEVDLVEDSRTHDRTHIATPERGNGGVARATYMKPHETAVRDIISDCVMELQVVWIFQASQESTSKPIARMEQRKRTCTVLVIATGVFL
jgi:hypothetical protein